MPILKGVASAEPKIGDKVEFWLNKWDGKQFYLSVDGNSWLSFELTGSEKMDLLKMLIKDWLG